LAEAINLGDRSFSVALIDFIFEDSTIEDYSHTKSLRNLEKDNDLVSSSLTLDEDALLLQITDLQSHIKIEKDLKNSLLKQTKFNANQLEESQKHAASILLELNNQVLLNSERLNKIAVKEQKIKNITLTLEGLKTSLLNQSLINQNLLRESNLKENVLQTRLNKQISSNATKLSLSKQKESEINASLIKQRELNESQLKVIKIKEVKITNVSLQLEILKTSLLNATALNEKVLKDTQHQESLLNAKILQSREELLKLENINEKILLDSQLREKELDEALVASELIKTKNLKEIQDLKKQIETASETIRSIKDELAKLTILNTQTLKEFATEIEDLKSSMNKEISLKNEWHNESNKNRGLLETAAVNEDLHRKNVIAKNNEHIAEIKRLTQQQMIEIQNKNDIFNRERSKQMLNYSSQLHLESVKQQGLIKDLRLAQNVIDRNKRTEELRLENEKRWLRRADDLRVEKEKKLDEETNRRFGGREQGHSTYEPAKKRWKRDGTRGVSVHLKTKNSAAYFYSNICEPQIIGSEKDRLLQVLSLNSRMTHINHLQYIPVALNRIPRIEILIKDNDGESFPFEDGTSVLKLHFKETLQQ
jgi:hypothetical protein